MRGKKPKKKIVSEKEEINKKRHTWDPNTKLVVVWGYFVVVHLKFYWWWEH